MMCYIYGLYKVRVLLFSNWLEYIVAGYMILNK